MKRLNERLKRLEALSHDAGPEKRDVCNPTAARAIQWQFERWQQRRTAANLPATREIYDAETAADDAARDAAWETHKASLSAEELAKIPTHPIAEAALRWEWWRIRGRRHGQ